MTTEAQAKIAAISQIVTAVINANASRYVSTEDIPKLIVDVGAALDNAADAGPPPRQRR